MNSNTAPVPHPARRGADHGRMATINVYNPGRASVVYTEQGHALDAHAHGTAPADDKITRRLLADGRLISKPTIKAQAKVNTIKAKPAAPQSTKEEQ